MCMLCLSFIVSFSESDVTLSTTYLDRVDNRIKQFDPTVDTRYQWAFVFQQAVDKLPDNVREALKTFYFVQL